MIAQRQHHCGYALQRPYLQWLCFFDKIIAYVCDLAAMSAWHRYHRQGNANFLRMLDFFQELGYGPYPLLWLRYTTFIVLYPLGVASELTMVYLALPYIRDTRKWSIQLPNTLNFGFDYYYFCLFALVVYVPGRVFSQAVCIIVRITRLPDKPCMQHH